MGMARALPWLLLLSLAACQPSFSSRGSFTVEGAAFTPTRCRVLAPEATGVALTDAQGRELRVALPPVTLKAFEEVSGTPTVTLQTGDTKRDLGPCGAAKLVGEGYHGGGRRAAKGELKLECAGLSGTLDFSGCF